MLGLRQGAGNTVPDAAVWVCAVLSARCCGKVDCNRAKLPWCATVHRHSGRRAVVAGTCYGDCDDKSEPAELSGQGVDIEKGRPLRAALFGM